jgi:hypothetical protein
MHEPTITGIAAGLHASNKLDPTIALAPSKLIEVEDSERGDGAGVRDIAIGDAMVSTDRCVGARAIWTADPIRQAFLADVWGIQRTHIVGHSLGGAIAAQFSLDHPNHVASVTVVNPAGFGDEIAETHINGIVQAQGRRVLKAALEMLRADASLASRQMVDDVLKYLRLDGVQSTVGEPLRVCSRMDNRQPPQGDTLTPLPCLPQSTRARKIARFRHHTPHMHPPALAFTFGVTPDTW